MGLVSVKNVTLLTVLLLAFNIIGCGQEQTVRDTSLKSILKNNHNSTNLTKYLNARAWDTLFPHRYGKGMKDTLNHNPDFYSFTAFVKAARLFPAFLNEGDEATQKRELAAFLANIAQETSGGWPSAPGGYFKWGLYFLEESQTGQIYSYADTLKKDYLPVNGKFYYGRGPKQLTWNYNYGQFSAAWYGDKDTLLEHPERLAHDPVLSFASAIWFWMTAQRPKPSCHDIITGKWQPTPDDL